MESLVKFTLKNYKFTIMLTFLVTIAGLMGMLKLNSESYPAVNLATAIIETDYQGAAPEDIETKITKPLEEKIREVSGLKDVRSISQSGKSTIIVRVDMDNENVEDVMADLEKAIGEVSTLPLDLLEDPRFIEMKSEEFPAIEIAVVGTNRDRLRDRVSNLLKEDLEDNRRVKRVILSGYTKREFTIELNQAKMDELHIGIDEVLQKIGSRNVDVPGGNLVAKGAQKLVRIKAKVRSIDDLKDLIVRSNFSGKTVFLKDIAKVVDGAEDARFLSNYNGEDSTVLVVNKKGGADTLKLVDDVSSIIERYQDIYKDQLKIIVYNNEAEKVKNRLGILSSNALGGLVLVVIFLFIFLPFRIGVAASISLPLAVMATFGWMPLFGMNLDAITILALVIALGMLVDNSVVISENFTRLRHDGVENFEAAIQSIRSLALPITATALTTIGAFLPMLVTRGIMGEFIKFIPIVVTISLVMSLFEGFFFLPLRLTMAGKNIKAFTDKDEADWFAPLVERFENGMGVLVRRRYWVGAIYTGLIIGSLLMMGLFNQFILFPADQTEAYLARIEAPRGTTLEETNLIAEDLSRKIMQTMGDDVRSIVAKIGSSAEMPADPLGQDGDSNGLLTIFVTEHAKYNLYYRDALAKLRTIEMPELKALNFQERVNGPPVGNAINATFRSNNAEELNHVVNTIQQSLSVVPGVSDLKVDDVIGDNEVFANIDYEKANRLGLSASVVGNAIRTSLSGSIVSDVTLHNKDVDLKVILRPEDRLNSKDILKIKVMDNRGNLIPLSTVVTLEEKAGTPQIKRFDFKRAKTLTGNVKENEITSVEANSRLQAEFDKMAAEYPSVSLVFGGEAESTAESMQSLASAMVLALIAIFCLMVFVFASYLKPLIIMSTIPLGLVGFSVAFFFHDRPISFLAMIGVVGLAGIIVNAGIVLISFIEEMREEGKLTLDEILVKASGIRLRAVVVTSLTTVSGLLPTAYGIGGSDEMLVPMTLAMAWGLISGTVLTLVWIPCAYAILEDFTEFFAKIRQMFADTVGAVLADLFEGLAHRFKSLFS